MSAIIAEHEERLRQAQLAGDVAALDALIAADLQFVFYDGSVYQKQMDLEAHRSGVIKIASLEFSEQVIRRQGDAATVTVKAKMAGRFSGQPFDATYRYGRTWLLKDGRWQVIAGSVSQLA